MSPTLEFDDFYALRRLIYNFSGIWLGDSKIIFLQVRLTERLRALNISSAREYYHFLKYDPQGQAEMQHLLDIVTINETWFFREVEPLLAWRDQVAAPLLKRRPRLRVWSAGCSTGEEPYTLAMLLLEAYPNTAATQFEILATDISTRAIHLARAGVYDPHSLRHTEQRWLDKYMRPARPAEAGTPSGLGPGVPGIKPDGTRSAAGREAPGRPNIGSNGTAPYQWTVIDQLRYLIDFQHASLVETSLPARIGLVDVVICRNVIIYFDEQSRQVVLNNFHQALKPGGYLILGHSESLAHVLSPFELARLDGVILYRKPEEKA